MSAATTISSSQSAHGEGADRIGVIASVLCAIHCAATPILLLFAPAFGEFWSHPASHWIVALFVVPLALLMVVRGFRIHRRRWIVAAGLLGTALVIAGAAIPYWPDVSEHSATALKTDESPPGDGDTAVEDDFVWVVGEALPGDDAEAKANAGGCLDSCCPSLMTDSEGNTKLHIPTASIVTTLGGVALICTHLGNLCACRKRRGTDSCDVPFC